jgi:hypothetical protein
MRHYEPPEDLSNTVFDPSSDTFGPIMAAIQNGDFEKAQELLARLTRTAVVTREEVVHAIRESWIAGHGDSNDDEIAKLQHALGLLITYTGFGWLSMPEPYTTYIEHGAEEPRLDVVEIDAVDRVAELDNGQWYTLDGPEGFFAKLDSGAIVEAEGR